MRKNQYPYADPIRITVGRRSIRRIVQSQWHCASNFCHPLSSHAMPYCHGAPRHYLLRPGHKYYYCYDITVDSTCRNSLIDSLPFTLKLFYRNYFDWQEIFHFKLFCSFCSSCYQLCSSLKKFNWREIVDVNAFCYSNYVCYVQYSLLFQLFLLFLV